MLMSRVILNQQFNYILSLSQYQSMNKRKIDLNQLKKNSVKGKKFRNIQVKYQIVLSYFKQKEVKEMKIFQVHFFPIIEDILNQLSNAQIIFKLQQNNKESLRPIAHIDSNIKLQTFYLKGLSKEYPIHEICQCLYIQKGAKQASIHLGIQKNKLMIFFKKLRLIYSDFCYCVGQKYILQPPQLKFFYQLFKSEWSKSQQKGRLTEVEKLQKRLCRSLYFLGVLIQNNIYEAIQSSQKKKIEQTAQIGTKSQKKKNIKGINQNVSSTYSFGSTDLVSNFSVRLKSQKSNEEDCYLKNYYLTNPYSQYSQKSQKIISKSKFGLWDKAQIKQLKFKIQGQGNAIQNSQKFQINYLSNDVQNILIEQAFKIRKFQDSCLKNQSYSNQTPYYCLPYPYQTYESFDYSQTQSQNAGYNLYNNYNYSNTNDNSYNNNEVLYQGEEINQLRRSFDFFNLVQTRKNPHRFTAKKSSNQNKYE